MAFNFLQVDIELTNRCNANCYFCPRDKTPHQGLMDPETFTQALARAVEFRTAARARIAADLPMNVSLCGLGEPLLHKHAPTFVRQVRDAGFFCSISSNGALLTEEKGRALLDAGLNRIDFNVGDLGEEYEEVYGLPWEKTRDRVLGFHAMAGDACEIQIVIVPHRGGHERTKAVTSFWQSQGLENFFIFPLTNRGGALDLGPAPAEGSPERRKAAALLSTLERQPLCLGPFVTLFIGYDGQYYLCCSDWTKETPLGSVFDRSFEDVIGPKLQHVVDREAVCTKCTFDPLNRLSDAMRAVQTSQRPGSAPEEVLAELVAQDAQVRDQAQRFGVSVPVASAPAPSSSTTKRVTLPVVGA